jgi:hypothetical protein
MADAPQEHPNQACAIKFYTADALGQAPVAAAFLEQAEEARQLEGPFLARVHRVLDLRPFRADGWPAVATVSQLIEPSLERVLADLVARAEALPAALVFRWARHLFEAVEALHGGYGYAHRHIKPSNVLPRLGREQIYRDVGTLDGATALLGDVAGACPLGTAGPGWWSQDEWKAPELFEQPYGPASAAEDLYALGLILGRLVARAEGDLLALARAAGGLADCSPDRRLAAKRELRGLLFPAEEVHHPADELVLQRYGGLESCLRHRLPARWRLRLRFRRWCPYSAGRSLCLRWRDRRAARLRLW